jgi:hypothetical protein
MYGKAQSQFSICSELSQHIAAVYQPNGCKQHFLQNVVSPFIRRAVEARSSGRSDKGRPFGFDAYVRV